MYTMLLHSLQRFAGGGHDCNNSLCDSIDNQRPFCWATSFCYSKEKSTGMWQLTRKCTQVLIHLVKSVKVKTCAWEWKRREPAIAHNLMPGTDVIMKRAHNSKSLMHNGGVTAACKTPSHTQSTVLYWLNEVNRSIVKVHGKTPIPSDTCYTRHSDYTVILANCPVFPGIVPFSVSQKHWKTGLSRFSFFPVEKKKKRKK